jgi:hypothetical protein
MFADFIISRLRDSATRQRIRLLFRSLASAMRCFGSIRVERLCLLASLRADESSSQRGRSFRVSHVGDSTGDISRIVDFCERR